MGDLLERIEINREKLSGKPVIRGTRIQVHLIVELVAEGLSPDEILEEYPELELQDVKAALLYAARVLRGEIDPGV